MKQWKRRIVSLWMVLLAVFTSFPAGVLAGELHLDGTVLPKTDKILIVTVLDESADPISGARVTVKDEQQEVTAPGTTSSGTAQIQGLAAGVPYAVHVECEGYEAWDLDEYRYQRQDGEPDTLLVTLTRIVQPSKPDTSRPDSSKPNGNSGKHPDGGGKQNEDTKEIHKETPEEPGSLPVISPVPENGENRYKIGSEIIENSVKQNADIEIRLPVEDGEGIYRLPGFDRHDRELLSDSALWVEDTGTSPYLHLIVPYNGEDRRQGKIPHNLMEASVKLGWKLRVSFEGKDRKAYDYSRYFTPEFFDREEFSHFDFGLRYDRALDAVELVLTKDSCHTSEKLPVFMELFETAGELLQDLVIEIYNPRDDQELWYVWRFSGEALKNADLSAFQVKAMDLSIRMEPEDGDPVIRQSIWWKSEYLIIGWQGALPVSARLEIRNKKPFYLSPELRYSNRESQKLEVEAKGLAANSEGFYAVELEHGSSFVLTGFCWLWLLLLIPLLYILYRIWKKKKEEAERREEEIPEPGDGNEKEE